MYISVGGSGDDVCIFENIFLFVSSMFDRL